MAELEEVTIKCSFPGDLQGGDPATCCNPSRAPTCASEKERNGEVYVQGLSDEYVSSSAC